ncbi:MAG: DUF4403 family protein [Chitinophagaceae bacterium]|nr:DUF4403 family protein [Chitinophagaceae bacterium]
MKHTTHNLIALLAAALLLYSCGSSKKLVTDEPAAHYLPSLPQSEINIPVKIYMKPLLTMMDSGTAKQFTNDKWPDYTQSGCDFRYKYRFIRSPFSFSCVNNKVSISFRGQYQIAGSKSVCAFDKQVSPWVGGSCGFGNEPLRRVDVSIGSFLELLPNHSFKTTTRLEQNKALDKCEVTILQTDITEQILDSIEASINTYAVAFDNFVKAINNHAMLKQWRSEGARVFPFSKYGYININPTQFRMGRMNIYKDTLIFSVGYTGSPKFASDSSSLINKKALSPLQTTAVSNGISTYLDAVYQYSFLNKLLNDSLQNKPFDVEGRTFVIKDVTIGGTNAGKLSIDISFTGNRKGVLHLSGTPQLDTASQVLTMPDIDFSIDTKDILVNMGKGLFRKKILKTLKDQTVFDIAALLERNKTVIQARLNQQVNAWMQTTGTIGSIKLVGLLPQREYIQVQAFINGTLQVIAKPPANLVKAF